MEKDMKLCNTVFKIIKYFFNSKYRKLINLYRGKYDYLNDEEYLKLKYKLVMGKELNLDNPKTFNEKLQWLKLYDRNSNYIKMVDKYEVKKYVSDILGQEYIIPTLGVWDKFDQIDFDKLPNQFVLKCTHDSGGIVICTNKDIFDKKRAQKILEKSLNRNYFNSGREWPYKNVKPRIIAEKYMVDDSGYELKDYKFFCFNGIAKIMFIASDRQNKKEETKFDFYDMEFNHLDIINGHPNSNKKLKKPLSFDIMKEFAEKISQSIPQARIDFYDIQGKIYFGEITLFHWSGMVPFVPDKWDYILGDWIKLPYEKK